MLTFSRRSFASARQKTGSRVTLYNKKRNEVEIHIASGPLLYSQQGALPQLPVASCADTLANFDRAASAYLPTLTRGKRLLADSLREARTLLLGADGQRLHSSLLTRVAAHDNWLERWWLNERRLVPRHPLPARSNCKFPKCAVTLCSIFNLGCVFCVVCFFVFWFWFLVWLVVVVMLIDD